MLVRVTWETRLVPLRSREGRSINIAGAVDQRDQKPTTLGGQHQGATALQISNAALQLPPQANMSAELELLWPLSGLLLLLLGTAAWLCVQCSRPGECHTGGEGREGWEGRVSQASVRRSQEGEYPGPDGGP